ncbi:MAG: hypothetical protein BAJATHORv1_30253 [Candidatus Thorarchaeota archaeon]|nr:MAG: hypothetical protein BAJATHORv1_30253 [Candidatus Thorarchaeota archaeon]
MKLFYRISPEKYDSLLEEVEKKFSMNKEVDEDRTILMLDDISQIEIVRGNYNPRTDDIAQVMVVLNDDSLREYFDSVFGEPYRVR